MESLACGLSPVQVPRSYPRSGFFAMERSTIFHGKIHYFYGHFPWQNVSSPEGIHFSLVTSHRLFFSQQELGCLKILLNRQMRLSICHTWGGPTVRVLNMSYHWIVPTRSHLHTMAPFWRILRLCWLVVIHRSLDTISSWWNVCKCLAPSRPYLWKPWLIGKELVDHKGGDSKHLVTF